MIKEIKQKRKLGRDENEKNLKIQKETRQKSYRFLKLQIF